jgi:hypothetical protein
MQIKNYKGFNPEIKVKINPNGKVEQEFRLMDIVLQFLKTNQPTIVQEYIEALKKRIAEDIEDFYIESTFFDLEPMRKDLQVLGNYTKLQELLIQFTCKNLGISTGDQVRTNEAEILSINRVKAQEVLSYYRLKALVDILGKEKAVPLWKEIVTFRIISARAKRPAEVEKVSMVDNLDRAVGIWTDIGMADFTRAIFDENKYLFRFDSCFTHEVLKNFNDPDIAYLATCYIGDAKEYNEEKVVHLRRTQTLHHGDFCDELYWNSEVYKDVEQPSLEYTRKLGRT